MRKHRTFVLGASLLVLALVAAACSSGGGDSTSSASATPSSLGTITVGVSGAFAENQIVAWMYSEVLQHAGYTVKTEDKLKTRDVSDTALTSGQIDLKPEYTGFELGFWNPKATVNGPPAKVAAALQKAAEQKDLTTFGYSPANSTNVFVTTPSTASQNHLSDMSSLAKPAPNLTLGAPSDCPKEPFCIPGMKKVYGITFGDFKSLDPGETMVTALNGGAIDVGELFSLDPLISQNHYTVLTDDKNLQADGNFVPLVRKQVATDQMGQLLDAVTSKLTDTNMRQMVDQVQNQHIDAQTVAENFLSSQGLL